MKHKIIIYGLLFIIYCLTACSSGTEKTKKGEHSQNTVSVDTSLKGLTGVIEKNPPVITGDYISKYPNGIIKLKGFYINGKREGQWTSFFENGKMQSEGFFKAGLRDGKAIVYYETGQVYYTGYYKDGKEVGKWVFYDQQGKKINKKNFGDTLSPSSKPNS